MTECIAFVSGKGGTGKTSMLSGIATGLARYNHQVLCIDMDMGFRNLDLSLGFRDEMLMDFTDVASKRCSLDRAIHRHHELENLHMLTAPVYPSDDLTPEAISPLFEQAEPFYDYILIDSSAGIERSFALSTHQVTRVIVVSTCELPALRGARRTVEELSQPANLLLNKMDKRVVKKMGFTIDDAMDTVGLPLIGYVPEDPKIPLYANEGKLFTKETKTGAGLAFDNIAQRLMGRRIPLMNL
ncbi:MAG: AAA family ATPase [Eubacteriales bacterium]